MCQSSTPSCLVHFTRCIYLKQTCIMTCSNGSIKTDGLAHGPANLEEITYIVQVHTEFYIWRTRLNAHWCLTYDWSSINRHASLSPLQGCKGWHEAFGRKVPQGVASGCDQSLQSRELLSTIGPKAMRPQGLLYNQLQKQTNVSSLEDTELNTCTKGTRSNGS